MGLSPKETHTALTDRVTVPVVLGMSPRDDNCSLVFLRLGSVLHVTQRL